ncbi:hypothetical protein B0H67DRAFT_590240 [Lasiosphaeris hirsuta]|uniref:Uncharacterized protein n=1 Tax=Lasiosphaeris hirsuta TaxID=260670 RepID=A0AA40A351_9PEZI|nr:hypothetical protein B0H67DRAFT_590240 [Lasiosphaeris hirsuta]
MMEKQNDKEPIPEKVKFIDSCEEWPPPPASPGKHGFLFYLGILMDVACILAAFPFLVLAGAAARLDGRVAPPDEWYMIYAAMNAAVTLFPIAYTAIVARTIKVLATWKLERGTTVGFLEQLLASRSLVGALQILWSLRVVNLVGVMLVTLAVISPIGGQASLQMLKIKDVANMTQADVTYLTTLNGSYSEFESGTYFYEALPGMNSMYAASLTASAPVKNSTMDLWGNVKIPSLSRLAAPADHVGWQDVAPDPSLEKYSSLIGIPARGLSPDTNTSYTLETSYFDLDCSKMVNGSTAECGNSTSTNTTKPAFYCFPGSTFSFGIDEMLASSYGPTWAYINDTDREFPQRTIRFASTSMPALTVAYCRISTAYVEAAVNCTGLSCAVSRMRPSLRPHPHPHLVPFEFLYYFNGFFWQLPLATKTQAATRGSQLTEYYINDPLLPLANTYRLLVPLFNVSPRDMSIRLGQVLNSYYLASLDAWGITGMSSGSGTPVSTANAETVVDGTFRNITTASTVSTNRVLYACQWAWWAVFVVACLVMFVVACIGALLNWRTEAPDILGYVSTMTRDSPHVSVPEGGSALDGTDRARLLKELRVQLQDVRPRDGVGYLAVASLEGPAKLPVADRMYK